MHVLSAVLQVLAHFVYLYGLYVYDYKLGGANTGIEKMILLYASALLTFVLGLAAHILYCLAIEDDDALRARKGRVVRASPAMTHGVV